MPLAIRHRADIVAPLAPLDGLHVRRERSPDRMARLQDKSIAEIGGRMVAGHRAYVASIDGVDAAFGWVATRHARIGELGIAFDVPAGERYLWNFVTLPERRGLGVYPRLLDAIVRAESDEAERFWIIWAPENRASGAGIDKAGFVEVAQLSFDEAGRPATSGLAGDATARMLEIAHVRGNLAPCWRCARAGKAWIMMCPPGECACDYQRRESGCAHESKG
jgi:hypothetical protein